MKTALLAGVLSLTASFAVADAATGVWKTEAGDTGGWLHVKIATCGAALCGTIDKAFNADGSNHASYEHVGKQMIWDMKVAEAGSYDGGKIWAPDKDKTYKSKMSLSGNKLTVKGCVAGGAICRGQTWTKVN